MNARKAASAASVAVLAALAACQSGGGPSPVASPVPQSPFEGEWVGTDGVAVSTLHGGTFSSRSVQTGETLTNGTYKVRDPSTIDLDFYSVKSQQRTTAACLLVNPGQMNCTLASGTQFVLNRRRV